MANLFPSPNRSLAGCMILEMVSNEFAWVHIWWAHTAAKRRGEVRCE